MGVKTVALYSEADGRSSLHASMADEKYKVGIGPTPAESYLRAQEVCNYISMEPTKLLQYEFI
jgi:acetyl/propionyl-CoA carboxylase alpha subunit